MDHLQEPFLDKLELNSDSPRSLLCLGIDPSEKIIPDSEKKFIDKCTTFLLSVLEKLADENIRPGAIKPNIAYFLALDRPRLGEFMGSRMLGRLLDVCEKLFPSTTLILDYKTGDIDRSSLAMAKGIFAGWRADVTTVHPYMGDDSIIPYLECGSAYILTKTSNPSACVIQDITTADEDETVFIRVGKLVANLATEHQGRVGAVVGATYPDELVALLKLWQGKDIPLLIPGVGSQGGKLGEILAQIKHYTINPFIHRINNGSKLWGAWKDFEGDPVDVVVEAIKNFGDELEDTYNQL